MKKIPKNFRIQLLFTVIGLLLQLSFEVVRGIPSAAAFWADEIAKPLRYLIARICSFTAWSVGEWLIAAAVIFVIVFMTISVISVIRNKGSRIKTALLRILLLCNIALYLWFFMCCNWGIGYYTAGHAARMGVYPVDSTPEELRQVTELFAEKVNEYADDVGRDESGAMLIDIDDVLRQSVTLMRPLEERINKFWDYEPLSGYELLPKKARFSYLMSCVNTTGYLFPYTGEANINIEAPACYLPCTVMHEISHQRGVATEQEANFFGILASVESDLPEFCYSGWLTGYTYLHNALYTADPEGTMEIYYSLSPDVLADLAANSAYWKQFESEVSEASDKAYDSFLKNYDQELGRKSYGAVVDLLMAYYM